MTPTRSLLVAAAFAALAATGARAQTSITLDFDSLTSGASANDAAPSFFSFHNAIYVPYTDAFGDDIAGTEHWTVDTDSDAAFPVTVDNPQDFGRGDAPTGTLALDALFQPVLIQFSTGFSLSSFSVTLDNDTFGDMLTIDFVSGSTTILSLDVDQTQPGLIVSQNAIGVVSGIVLPGGAFYDHLTISGVAVPEPSTWATMAGVIVLGFGVLRRRHKA